MPATMSYQAALDYLDSLVNFERMPPDRQARKVQLDLARIEWLTEQLGRPQDDLPCVHVAGTKGKGSICAMAESIARAAGLATGIFTSPHLVDLRERIRVGGRKIAPEEFARHMAEIRPHVEAVRHKPEIRRPTYFEVMTHLALVHFVRSGVEMAAIEVGMGGRLDATNVVRPAACAIANISIDHTRQLGETLAEIAAEKAGIIKPAVPVVVSPNRPEAMGAIRTAAEARGAPLVLVGEDVTVEHDAGGDFSVTTGRARYDGLATALAGRHQRENAAAAVALVEEFFAATGRGELPAGTVREGLLGVRWPGRVEKVADSPLVILDGAHNSASMEALLETVQSEFAPARIVVLFGAADDKDIAGMVGAMRERCSGLVLTRSGNPRQKELTRLVEAVGRAGGSGECVADFDAALSYARDLAGEDGAVVVTGSLYLVGRAMTAMRVSAALEP